MGLNISPAAKKYDIVIIDSSDPVGPAVGLFDPNFMPAARPKDDGLFVAQTESPWLNFDITLPEIYQGIKSAFPLTRMYLCNIPTYPCGVWSFTLGSKRHDPLQVDPDKIIDLGYRYYNRDIHRAAFALPQFLRQLLNEAGQP